MKKIKIIIPILLIIIVAAAAAVYVLSTGKLAITPKSKVAVGLSKTLNTFDESEGVISQANYKILENLNGKPYESEVTMSIDADIEDLESIIGDKDTAALVNDVLDTLADTKISTKVALDSKEDVAAVELGLENEDLIGAITGDVAISSDEIAFRSKELNENYLSLTKEDAEDNPELQQIFDYAQQIINMNYTKLMFTEEEIQHFSDTYGKILSNSVKDEMITSEDSEFTVNGSKQSCTKAILTYNNDQLKELLKTYVSTFEKDEKGKEILENKLSALYGDELTEELMSKVDTMIEDLNTMIDEIVDTKLEFVTYATVTKTFGTETILTIQEESASIKETFNDDNTTIVFDILGEEVANIVIKQTEDSLSVEYSMNIDGTQAAVKFIMNKNKADLTFDIMQDEEILCNLGISLEVDTKKDSDKELVQDLIAKITFEIPLGEENLTGTVSMNATEKMAIVDSVKFPDTSEATSLMDNEDLQKYFTDAQDAATKYLEKLQKNELVKDIMEIYSANSTTSDILNDIEDTDVETNTTELSEVDIADLEKNIKTWYTELEEDEDLKKSEIIEENMISEFDFDDMVEITTYISWEEGTATDKGYVGIEVTDLDDNSYEFYIDIETDKIYTEDTVTFDTASVEWNEF